MVFTHVIIGGGFTGLLLAKSIKDKYPAEEVVLFEKKTFVGEMASSRNSGVLHAGLYYPSSSMKLKHCLRGNLLWRDIAQDLGISLKSCGKFVISTNIGEDEKLLKLFDNALANKVPSIRWARASELEKLKEYCYVSKAFFSGSTAVLDISDALKKLEAYCDRLGVHILKSDDVESLSINCDGTFAIESSKESIQSRYLYNCAGVEAPGVRKLLGLNDIESLPVKGNYVRLNKKYYNDTLIYPVPPEDLKGLGIHTSFGADGVIRFGPDTEDVPSMTNIDLRVDEKRVDQMFSGIQSIFKNIERSDLHEDYSGIRAKIVKNGELYQDFIVGKKDFHGIHNYYELLGVESPGMTSAPSLIEAIVHDI